jgi:hypothetical protein
VRAIHFIAPFKKIKIAADILREGSPEDHPIRIGARRRKFFFSILLPKTIELE